MEKYKDYNIISIGDHCVTSMILKELGIRRKAYPFDWVTKNDQICDTNIIYNIDIINSLQNTSIETIAENYIGDALTNGNINSITNISFQHESGTKDEIFQKYVRRFRRLKDDMYEKNIFIFVTRYYYIESVIFTRYINILRLFNKDSLIIFISGIDHPYFDTIRDDRIIFKYIPYDISRIYEYDYNEFRPQIKAFLSNFLFEMQ